MWAIPGPIDCELREYNVDLGDRFGDRSVYFKVPMRFEDFGKEEKTMLPTPKYIRERIVFATNVDPSTMFYTIEASFQLSPNEPRLKTSGMISLLDPDIDIKRVCDHKEKLVEALIHEVQSYYEIRDIKEDNNMPVHFCCERLSDETLKALGTFTNSTATKPKWINGLPAVKKVEVYNNRVVKVTFIDDTFTKSICSENDNFDLDVGITICALKRLLGTNSDDATKQYNKFVKHVHKVMEENDLKAAAEQGRKINEKAKRRKIELKKAAEKLKAKEAQIDIQKQAYLRAMMEMTEDDLK